MRFGKVDIHHSLSVSVLKYFLGGMHYETLLSEENHFCNTKKVGDLCLGRL